MFPNKSIKYTPRLIEFDIIKCLAIFLVIWEHSILHFSSNANSNGVYITISAFNMPLFMMMAGFFSSKALTLPISELFKRKFYQLIWPCISFGIFFMIIDYSINFFRDVSFHNSISYLFSCLWFLKSTFLCFIISWLGLRITKNNILLALPLLIIISQFIPIFKINWMLPFFIMGYIISTRYYIIQKYAKPLFLISIFSFAICLWLMHSFANAGGHSLQEYKAQLMNGDFSRISTILWLQLERIILGLLGSLSVISGINLCKDKFKNQYFLKGLTKYGQDTLGIYIMQSVLLEIILARLINLDGVNIWIFSFIVCPLLSLIVMDICYKLVTWIKRRKKLNFICFHAKYGV